MNCLYSVYLRLDFLCLVRFVLFVLFVLLCLLPPIVVGAVDAVRPFLSKSLSSLALILESGPTRSSSCTFVKDDDLETKGAEDSKGAEL